MCAISDQFCGLFFIQMAKCSDYIDMTSQPERFTYARGSRSRPQRFSTNPFKTEFSINVYKFWYKTLNK